jgi:hypothetical protein
VNFKNIYTSEYFIINSFVLKCRKVSCNIWSRTLDNLPHVYFSSLLSICMFQLPSLIAMYIILPFGHRPKKNKIKLENTSYIKQFQNKINNLHIV